MASQSGKGNKALDNLMMSYTDLSAGGKGSSFKGPALKDVQRTRAAAPAFTPSDKSRDWSSLSQNLEDAFSASSPTAARPTQMPFQPVYQQQQQQPVYQQQQQQQTVYQQQQQQQQPAYQQPQAVQQQQDDWGDFQSYSMPVAVPAAPSQTPIFQKVSPAAVPAPQPPHQHILYQPQPVVQQPVVPKAAEDDFADFISAAPPTPKVKSGPSSLPLTTTTQQRPIIKTTKYPTKKQQQQQQQRDNDAALGTFGDFASPTETSKPAFGFPASKATPDMFPAPMRNADFSLHAPPKQTVVHVKENPINAFADFASPVPKPAPVAAAVARPAQPAVGVLRPVAVPNNADKYGAFRSLFSDDPEPPAPELKQPEPLPAAAAAEEDDFGDFAAPVAAAPVIPKAAAASPLPKTHIPKKKAPLKVLPFNPSLDLFSAAPNPKSAGSNLMSNQDLLSLPIEPPPVMDVSQAVDMLATISLAPQSLPPLSIPEPVAALQPAKKQDFCPVATRSSAAKVVPWISDTPPPPPDDMGGIDEEDEFAGGFSSHQAIEEDLTPPPKSVTKPVFVPKIVRSESPAAIMESLPAVKESSPVVMETPAAVIERPTAVIESPAAALDEIEASMDRLSNEDAMSTRKSSGSSLNFQTGVIVSEEEEASAAVSVESNGNDDVTSLSGDDEILVSDWLSALIEVEKLFSSANAKFASIEEDDETLEEVLGAAETRDYFRNLSEVYRVTLRIQIACSSRALLVSNLSERIDAITDLWHALLRVTGSPLEAIPPPSHLRSGQDPRSNCGVCQLDVNLGVACNGEDMDDNDVMNAAVLSYGPKRYHAACANFWVNCVRPMLPSLL